WPRDRAPSLDEPTERALAQLLPSLSPEARGPIVSLAVRWGSKGFEKYTAEIAASLSATAKDATKTDAARIEAARQWVAFRKPDADTVKDLLELITPRTSPALATGLIESLGLSESPQVATAIVNGLGSLTPAVQQAALRVLLGRAEWTKAL